MIEKLRDNIHYLYIFSLLVLVTGLPLAKFLVSVSQFMLAGTWLIDGLLHNNFREKFHRFLRSLPALLLVSLFILHITGLIFTTDFNYALKDLRTKLPLLILPFILFSVDPPGPKETRFIYIIFILSTLAGTLISTGLYFTTDFLDVREVVKPLNSHIRFSLCVAISVILLLNFIRTGSMGKKSGLILGVALAGWFIVFLVLIESVAVLFMLLILSGIWVISRAFRRKKPYFRPVFFMFFLAGVLFIILFINNTVRDYRIPDRNEMKNLPAKTAGGNFYIHDSLSLPVENGRFIGLNVCEPELEKGWNSRSSLPYDGLDKRGQEIRFTIIRYLNSLGLTKDQEGINKLGEKDIQYIEKGYANVEYTRPFSLKSRIYKLLWESEQARRKGNPGGHSMLQRFEYAKTSLDIIKDNFWTGVGTGDMNIAFDEEYRRRDSSLGEQFRLRSHNQYLSIMVGFGIFGFAWFCVVLFYPVIREKRYHSFLFLNIYLVMLFSMLFEDTLETQAGVTLFSFFYAFMFRTE